MKKIGSGCVQKSCNVCNKLFKARRDRPGLFCDVFCQRIGRKKRSKQIIQSTCHHCGKKFSRRKGREGKMLYCSIKCMSICRGKKMSGENHPNWKGGTSNRPWSVTKAIRDAKKIFQVCKICNSKENLQGHHILKYSERPELATDLNNIEIICANCHAKIHPEISYMISYPKKRSGKIINCIICDKERYVRPYLFGTAKYCSRLCQLKGLHGKVDIKSNKSQEKRRLTQRSTRT